MEWEDRHGLIQLPNGSWVRGRKLQDNPSAADFTLVLTRGEPPGNAHRRIVWPDFWIPRDTDDAIEALKEAYRRVGAGERVEAACGGGIGRTGTALAALAILDGLSPADALTWVRAGYHPRAVETPWQRRWLNRVRG